MMQPKSVNGFNQEEIDLFTRMVIDAARIGAILIDHEYAPDFKRKLISNQVKYVLDAYSKWVKEIESTRNQDDQRYILGEDLELTVEDCSPMTAANLDLSDYWEKNND